PAEEEMSNIRVKHIIKPGWFPPTRFKPWFLVRFALMIIYGSLRLLRTSADIYHAHDGEALPACYIAALVRRKPLIFDAHELPLSDAKLRRWRRLHALATRFLAGMLPRCAGVITVSPPIAREIERHYRSPGVTVVRNVPAYQQVLRSERLRQ